MNQTSSADSTKTDTTRLTTAWEWVLRLRQDSVGQEDLVEWLAWYEADERNKGAFEEMQAFWQQADRVTEDPDPLSPMLWLGDLAAIENLQETKLSTGSHLESRRRSSPTRGFGLHRKWAWATAALAAGVFALFLVSRPRVLPEQSKQTRIENSATGPSSTFVRETLLPDGSRIELAPKSSVSVQFTEKLRGLLMSQGVAYFTVAHNRNRPFVVNVANVNVRAVGTAFNIRNTGNRVVVTVAEGTIDVYPTPVNGAVDSSGQSGAGSFRVRAGSEIVWPTDGHEGPTITAVDTSHALAWRQGQLDYINEPLASAIVDINRYSRRPIIVHDDAVGKIIFSGTVRISETDAWVQALPELFPVDVKKDASGDIVLMGRSSNKNTPIESAR